MGSFSIWHWLVVAVIVALLFGRGRIADIMGEVGRGITGFRRGLIDDPAQLAQSLGETSRASTER